MQATPTRRQKVFLFAFIVSFLLTTQVQAQQYRATITGKLTNPTGSAVPNADIVVTGAGTDFTTSSKSDESGNYAVPFLVPGTYSLKVSATGFASAVRERIELHAGDKSQVDIPLQLGQTNQAVTVEANGELLQTATASVGQVIDSQQSRDLPVLGRNPFMLAALTTGVSSGLYNAARSVSSDVPSTARLPRCPLAASGPAT